MLQGWWKVNYSLEFKQYVQKTVHSTYIQVVINVPSKYKKLDSDDNLVIDKELFQGPRLW